MSLSKLSKREKTMLAILGIILFCFIWYQFIFTNLQDRKSEIQSEISTVETTVMESQVKLKKQDKMLESINNYKASGVKPREIVKYLDTLEVSSKLKPILASAHTYDIKFDEGNKAAQIEAKKREERKKAAQAAAQQNASDKSTSSSAPDEAQKPQDLTCSSELTFSTNSYVDAYTFVTEIVNSTYPSSIDSIIVNDNTVVKDNKSIAQANTSKSDPCQLSLHLTYNLDPNKNAEKKDSKKGIPTSSAAEGTLPKPEAKKQDQPKQEKNVSTVGAGQKDSTDQQAKKTTQSKKSANNAEHSSESGSIPRTEDSFPTQTALILGIVAVAAGALGIITKRHWNN